MASNRPVNDIGLDDRDAPRNDRPDNTNRDRSN